MILKRGDQVAITHAASQEEASILDGYTLTVEGRAQAQVTLPEPDAAAGDLTGEAGEAPAA